VKTQTKGLGPGVNIKCKNNIRSSTNTDLKILYPANIVVGVGFKVVSTLTWWEDVISGNCLAYIGMLLSTKCFVKGQGIGFIPWPLQCHYTRAHIRSTT